MYHLVARPIEVYRFLAFAPPKLLSLNCWNGSVAPVGGRHKGKLTNTSVQFYDYVTMNQGVTEVPSSNGGSFRNKSEMSPSPVAPQGSTQKNEDFGSGRKNTVDGKSKQARTEMVLGSFVFLLV